ncbi:hypothetical protein BGZ80_007810 [Entomortierella chlamydospora]|uniref:Uncharacterized protein n=1 Tax=Entomortierella chlamydospora TaxID=101097 RepID=A0A9P6MYG8_9FUNG|nr:hypothetical protein BGZ80_007810 [Entomortierella chlamydospora]
MAIFHIKWSAKCYTFGGCSTFRSGTIDDFEPFLNVPDTWYFVDSSLDPILNRAKTIIAASPKTLYSEVNQYREVDKAVPWRYFVVSWIPEELKECRTSVEGFGVVPDEAIEDFYSKVGGELKQHGNLKIAKTTALERLKLALGRVNEPVVLMQLFSPGKDTLDFSSSVSYRAEFWFDNSFRDHSMYRLDWASTYVASHVAALPSESVCTHILTRLTKDPIGSASGIMLEVYVLHAFGEGGHIFEIKYLESGQLSQLEIPRNPETMDFSTITQTTEGHYAYQGAATLPVWIF